MRRMCGLLGVLGQRLLRVAGSQPISFTNRDQARSAIFHYIEGFYNPARRHSAIGYHSPTDYEGSAQPPC